MVTERGRAVQANGSREMAGNDVGNRRTAWRIASVKPEDEQQATYVRKYVMKVEAGLQKIYDGILTLMDKDLIPSAATGEMTTDALQSLLAGTPRARPCRKKRSPTKLRVTLRIRKKKIHQCR